MTSSAEPEPADAGSTREVATLCAALREHLDAERVIVWRHHLLSSRFSPFATSSRVTGDELGALAGWALTDVADLPPFARVLTSGQAASSADSDVAEGGLFPRLAQQLGIRSLWCGPLLPGGQLGVVTVEPPACAAALSDATSRGLMAGAAAGLAWRRAEQMRSQAELFLQLTEMASTERLGPILARACEELAGLFGVRRVSVFLREGGRVVPQMSRFADGTLDPALWELFRNPPQPSALVEAVLREGTAQAATDPSSPLIAGWWSRSLGIEAALGLPLQWGGQVLGALVLDERHPRQFSLDYQRLAEQLAVQLAGVVARATGRRTDKQSLVVATALRSLLEAGATSCSLLEAAEAVARTAAQVLDVDMACTYVVDQDRRVTELAAVGADRSQVEALRAVLIGAQADGSPVWRASVDAPVPGPHFVDDTSAPGQVRRGGMAHVLGMRCLAAIPLLSSSGPIGVVVCGSTVATRHWRSSEWDLLSEFALQGTIIIDNARLREAERYQVAHDSLTGLTSRAAFQDLLASALARARRSGLPLAVVLADLNRFKEVNDTLGHQHGDLLLREVALRLQGALREGDVLARLGGDEFCMLLAETDAHGAVVTAARLEAALADTFHIDGLRTEVGASVGIACHPEHGDTPESLLMHADIAMYSAKRTGVPYCVYDAESDRRLPGQQTLLGELSRALASGELELHYQPKVDLRRREVTGVEALVRWRHPRLGLLGPGDFVPLAEKSGLIRRVTSWVLPHALEQCASWRLQGIDLSVAVNISARDLDDPRLAANIEGWLDAAGVPPGRLVVELTESALMSDLEQGQVLLSRLRELGVRVSLDDFGTGYSSLTYLETLPIDEVKIDRSIITRYMTNPKSVVLRSIVELSHALGLEVVAEGVETMEAITRLTDLGCDTMQGFVCSRPLPPQGLETWLTTQSAWGRACWTPLSLAARLSG